MFISGVAGLGLAVLTIAVFIGASGYKDLADARGSLHASLTVAGRIAGLAAITLVLMQYTLSARFKFLDRLIGLDRLLILHRGLGLTALILAASHPMLIYSDPVNKLGQLRWELWPEMIGASALTLLAVIIITSLGRGFLQIPYHIWRSIHLLVFAAAATGVTHMLKKGCNLQPAWAIAFWLAVLAAYIAIFIRVKLIKPKMLRQNPFTIIDVARPNHNTMQLTLRPADDFTFSYLPGQFAFLRLIKSSLPREEHPFTISSCPATNASLIFTIKKSGDYTDKIAAVRPGDLAAIDGPYGRFSYSFIRKNSDLLFIAGGIGVTPILSMLGDLADRNDPRHITLIWANRTLDDLVFADEFERFRGRLPNFRNFYLFSRTASPPHHFGRIDDAFLRKTLNDLDLRAETFLCGPSEMMKNTIQILKILHFPRRRIHSERFSL
jgi:predicted ferric reductase